MVHALYCWLKLMSQAKCDLSMCEVIGADITEWGQGDDYHRVNTNEDPTQTFMMGSKGTADYPIRYQSFEMDCL